MKRDIFFANKAKHPCIWGCFASNPVYMVVGKEGLEPSHLAAHDPKSAIAAFHASLFVKYVPIIPRKAINGLK